MAEKLQHRNRLATLHILSMLAVGGGLLLAFLSPLIWPHRTNPPRPSCRQNLMQIGVALNNYDEYHGHLPPAVVIGKEGKPLYSWRVLILPFLDHRELYEKFKLDEPWNSPHNARLSKQLIQVYQCSTMEGKEVDGYPSTSYVVPIGPRSVMGMNRSTSLERVAKADGIEKTILIVEHPSHAVPWAAPDTLTPEQFLAEFRPSDIEDKVIVHANGTNVLTVEGGVKHLPATYRYIDRALDWSDGKETPGF